MASLLYSEDLTCSVCLTIFTDPVTLPCGHSFCRKCITAVLNTQQQCPHCRTDVATEAQCLPTSLILKSLAEKAKESERTRKERGDERAQVAELCPEHEEKLKLFCVTDQQLACIICRDGERHKGHNFKPVKEAAASMREELEVFLEQAAGDISAIESLANTQKEEITKTKEKSQQLMTQISSQFEEMYGFLKKREDEIKNELKCKEKDSVGIMTEALNAIETALSESRELEAKATSVLKITDSERFLKSWADSSSMMTPEHLLRPRANELQVVNTSLSLEPYESHLQFFVWKEMLQVIHPRAEHLTLKSDSPDVVVSDDGRSLFCKPKTNQANPVPAVTAGSSGLFGNSVTAASSCASLFTASAFGSPSAPPAFGRSSTASAFGKSSTASAFGKSSTASAFGKSSTASAFGRSSTASAFGKSSTASAFGKSSTASAFGRSSTSSAFGKSSTPPAFGSPSAPPAFGSPSAPPAFGSPSAPPAFGRSSTSPAFGSPSAPPAFGSPSAVTASNCSAVSVRYHTLGVSAFTSGQHYWEIEVGNREYWALGIKDNFFKYEKQEYATCGPNTTTELTFENKPRKIGIYLSFSSNTLSFYDADNMTHIHTMSVTVSMPVSACIKINHKEPDYSPITVCWY
ncbi:uncharacterized protein [Leuresthes tenuis]|uniref:uncharacterized protein n=1 Tax=Leuresthes tenuis TaxID=355514 RepID=UPI003B507561